MQIRRRLRDQNRLRSSCPRKGLKVHMALSKQQPEEKMQEVEGSF